MEGVSKRLSQTQDAVHRPSAASVEQRLAATRVLIADKTGAVGRVLRRWRRGGLIDTRRRWVAVMEGAALKRLRDGG